MSDTDLLEIKTRKSELHNSFRRLLDDVLRLLPEGPDKTAAIRAIGTVKADCEVAIENGGLISSLRRQ